VVELPIGGIGTGTIADGSSESPDVSVIEVEANVPVAMGACDAPSVIGEVAAVGTVEDVDRAHRRAGRPERIDCKAAALQYAGLIPVEDRFELPQSVDDHTTADSSVSWGLSLNVLDRWVLPTPVLTAAGKSWAACVVSARQGKYSGRLADAFSSGRLPDEFGNCWNTREIGVASDPVDCGEPHLAEVISIGRIRDRVATNPDEVNKSCHTLAARVMRRTDPTDAGRLAIAMTPKTFGSSLTGVRSITIVCYVVPVEQRVLGSLVGLAAQPVHYVS
jgi:hypothetical protein